jgi:hypothetical protein
MDHTWGRSFHGGFFELGPQGGINKVEPLITFNMFNVSFWYISYHNLVLFLFRFLIKILLDLCLAHVMFLFLLFLFHVVDLELGPPLFLSWFRNPIGLVVFVPIVI